MPRNEQQFMQLIADNRGIIFKVIRLYVDHPEDEKDLYQEILYQAWKSFDAFESKSKFSTWLYKVSFYTVLSFKKRAKKIEITDKLPDVSNEENIINKDNSELLYDAMKALNAADKMIMMLHLEGYNNEEIAEMAGVNKNNLAVKLHRIKHSIILKLKTCWI
jgi:RNA polymerase sigma factor (sigma-70 family)